MGEEGRQPSIADEGFQAILDGLRIIIEKEEALGQVTDQIRQDFLLQLGDCLSDINKAVKEAEDDLRVQDKNRLEMDLMAQGFTRKIASETADKGQNWRVSARADKMLALIKAEQDQVKN